MTKFCPNCGNKMSDNATFCMACGAKLSEYTSGGVDMQDSVVQRSQVGAASVGNVNISPTIAPTSEKESKASSGGNACPKCGFTMNFISGKKNSDITWKNRKLYFHAYISEGYGCPKCGYKYVINYSGRDSGYVTSDDKYFSDDEKFLPYKKALELSGWDVSLL